uniref:Uncharacterized protein n=1 Tax=Siphoviridae sp. ctWT735 TaxID=2825538 RepID=A0A8S5TU76_9CAUD|nr:MAG TPA: Protein of unknown function (DUF3889) [Siphoviridae sp. ctWT735]
MKKMEDGICILNKSKRIRAKNGRQAIKIFQQKYPKLEIIGWR